MHDLYQIATIDHAMVVATIDTAMWILALLSAPLGIGIMLGTIEAGISRNKAA